MRVRYYVMVLVVGVVAVLLLELAQSDDSSDGTSVSAPAAAEALAGDTPSDSPEEGGNATAEPTPSPTPFVRAATNIPMEKLAPGERPPQFIIFSFDGGAGDENWDRFLEAAAVHDARFVVFLTGIYLLGDEAKAAKVYTGPGHDPGEAAIGYGGTQDVIVTQVENLNLAYGRGHEIGTHYNGHFCMDNRPGGDDWTAADWTNELDQFFTFMTQWKELNGYTDVPDLQVPPEAVVGGRTQCLEGLWEALLPAWNAHNFIYDSSMAAPYSGIGWPQLIDGIWEFHIPYAYSPPFGMNTILDYNFWVSFNGAANEPERAPELRAMVLETYEYLYDLAYNGNRAPLQVAGHYNSWNGDAFNSAFEDFMRTVCGEPDTYCTTYEDVVAWMELQDPAVLAGILAQPPVAASAPVG